MLRSEIDQLLRTALGYHQAGQRAQAELLYRQILVRSPEHDGAFHWLGVSALQSNRPDLAIEYLRRASVIQPNVSAYHANLGNALMAVGRLDEAAISYRRSLELKPDMAEAHNALGNALMGQGNADEAATCYRRAVELKPDYAEAHNNLGNVLREQGKLDEAVDRYRRAVELKPGYAEAYNNLGNALQGQGNADEAATQYRRSLELKPGVAETHNGLASALKDRRMLIDAEAHFNEAIRLRPDYGHAHFGRSMLWLLQGDFRRGWAEYEWRWDAHKHSAPRRTFVQPQWDGRPLGGRTIFLYSEQGFGDTLQFIRYVRPIIEAGGNVVVGCQPQLKRLLQSTLGETPIVDYNEALPAFDVQCPLMSLPMVCRTTLETIPRQLPGVRADPALISQWRTKLAGDVGQVKVGLAWAGSKSQSNDHNRSMALATLAPLSQVPHVRYYSLQKGASAPRAAEPRGGLQLIDRTDELIDFADTAALIANLDLVISVDTSVSHLAGAMGKPVWTLLSFAACWRYLLEREDSPWYPTMRLFRQPALGDWPSVIERVAAELYSTRRELRHQSDA